VTVPAVLHDLDITEPGFFLRDDYYDLLAWLRENAPLHPAGDRTVLVSRYDDIREISRRPDVFSSRYGALVNDPLRGSSPDDDAGSILHLDPPLHAAYRKLLNREFTPRAAGRLEPAIVAATERAFAALPVGEEFDFVEHIAAPVPVIVIAELLGIADGDRSDFRRWSDAIMEITDTPTPDAQAAAAELFAFLDTHVRQRFTAPGDDLLSLLASSSVDGRPLTHAQVMMFALTLLVAGNETTRSLVSGAALTLARHPDQRATLAADPALLPGAVEECLRWVTPIQAFCRTATQPVELAGGQVEEGDYLVLLYASGNRDEAAFGAMAGEFDVARPPTPAHVAFGFGEHLCLGAALARLEARIVLGELLRRFPRYELTGEPRYVPSTLARNIATMGVRLAG
jgi:cytochrome P450